MFEFGDRVKVIDVVDNNDLRGYIGTVVGGRSHGNEFFVAVEFDDKIKRGHDCNEQGQYGHCWYCEEDKLQPYTDEYIFTEEEINNILGF